MQLPAYIYMDFHRPLAVVFLVLFPLAAAFGSFPTRAFTIIDLSSIASVPLASIDAKSTALHLCRFDAPLPPSWPDPPPFAGVDSSSMASVPPSSSPPDPPPFTVADFVPP
ncbi:hypothetical protein PVAP13_5KG431500 [Panicum virgatum]|uniref:Uncharacterized protein n=1 Tax=Panicum virgatum TaxID=38727 RepID=A0A8T0SMG5_PANVG|nr:hypothetical protein PVAP13_5KG431500 [Panicum virgatum]